MRNTPEAVSEIDEIQGLGYDRDMSKRTERRTNKTALRNLSEIMEGILEYATAFVMVVLCVLLPLYAKDGYYQIGDAKFQIYRVIILYGMGVLLVLELLYLAGCVLCRREMTISVTDCLVASYLMFMAASVLSGAYYEDMLWGSQGWYMGFFSQLSFVLIYLFVSRFGRYDRSVLTVLCLSASIVFGIGVLHRLQIDPIGFYDGLTGEQKAEFLSTLGQATWYASFLIVVLPVGIAAFLHMQDRIQTIAAGGFVLLGMATLVSQNSDSAYFALGGFMLVFLWDAVRQKETMLRYLLVWVMFFAAGKGMYLLMKLRPNPEFEPDFVSLLINGTWVGWAMLVICLLLWGYGVMCRKPYSAEKMRRLPKACFRLVLVVILASGTVLVLEAKGLLPDALQGITEKIPYLHWDKEWGNGRGRIWSLTAQMFKEASLPQKLFGVGPDCYYSYLQDRYLEELHLYWGEKILTNAHNEWFTMLINTGIFGALSYFGIFATMTFRCLHSRRQDALLLGVAGALVSYMAYNFFCYQQVLCTPFIFLLIGMGEYRLRSS